MQAMCPECGQSVAVSDHLRGSSVSCPNCKRSVSIPTASSAPSAGRSAGSRKPPISLQRTCPACDARFPADHNICPECRTNYAKARGLGKHGVQDFKAFAPERVALSRGTWRGGFLGLFVLVGNWLRILLTGGKSRQRAASRDAQQSRRRRSARRR